jgi:hypothetical protein
MRSGGDSGQESFGTEVHELRDRNRDLLEVNRLLCDENCSLRRLVAKNRAQLAVMLRETQAAMLRHIQGRWKR